MKQVSALMIVIMKQIIMNIMDYAIKVVQMEYIIIIDVNANCKSVFLVHQLH